MKTVLKDEIIHVHLYECEHIWKKDEDENVPEECPVCEAILLIKLIKSDLEKSKLSACNSKLCINYALNSINNFLSKLN